MELVGLIKEYHPDLSGKKYADFKSGFNYQNKKIIRCLNARILLLLQCKTRRHYFVEIDEINYLMQS